MDEFLLPSHDHTSITEMVDEAKIRWFERNREKCGSFPNKLLKNNRDNAMSLNKERVVFIDRRGREQSSCKLPTSYLGRCAYFFNDLEETEDSQNKGLHMLSHVTRTVKFAPPLVFTKVKYSITNDENDIRLVFDFVFD